MRAWRRVLRRQGMIGRDPRRYGGLGFGNLSVRDPLDPRRFVITASQTGGARDLRQQDLVRIVSLSLARFWVEAEGRKPPSSETLSHAMVYAADDSVRWVLHVHSPEIWQQADVLGLPGTPAHVPYGSRAMADAVAALLQSEPARPMVFTTRGHGDGVFACGHDADDTGLALLRALARGLRR
jgi:ribulose-5-phosphate 4-epimerase/fuculose-1-phosphate aldolase